MNQAAYIKGYVDKMATFGDLPPYEHLCWDPRHSKNLSAGHRPCFEMCAPVSDLKATYKQAGVWDSLKNWQGFGATAASPFAQGLLANPYLRSMLLGGLVGGGINMYRNWDNEDQSLAKSFLYGAMPGAAIGAGLQYALPNAKKFTRWGPPRPNPRLPVPSMPASGEYVNRVAGVPFAISKSMIEAQKAQTPEAGQQDPYGGLQGQFDNSNLAYNPYPGQ